jgi:hypothetical protein
VFLNSVPTTRARTSCFRPAFFQDDPLHLVCSLSLLAVRPPDKYRGIPVHRLGPKLDGSRPPSWYQVVVVPLEPLTFHPEPGREVVQLWAVGLVGEEMAPQVSVLGAHPLGLVLACPMVGLSDVLHEGIYVDHATASS